MSIDKFIPKNPNSKIKKKKMTETMISLVRKFVKDKCNTNLEDFIKNLNWSESFELYFNLLHNSLTIEDVNYLETKYYKQIEDFRNKDWKTIYQFGLGIMLGWIIEEACIMLFSKEKEIKCILKENKTRKFLINPKSIYDFDLYFNTEKIPLDIKQNYNGEWEKNKEIVFRFNAYSNLRMNYAIVFGVDLENNQVLMINLRTSKNKVEYIEHYEKFGDRHCYRMILNENDFCSWDNWKNKFIDITKCDICGKPKRKKKNGYCHKCKIELNQQKRLNNNV